VTGYFLVMRFENGVLEVTVEGTAAVQELERI
jgi:hypothetical protein